LGKVIQDIWILTDGGVVVFSRTFDTKVDDQLFGALMTALNAFANELSDGGLTNFELSNIKFTLLKANDFIFIANSSNKVKEKKVQKALKKISEKFYAKYSINLENWDCDITLFSDFEDNIKDKLENPIKKFWQDI